MTSSNDERRYSEDEFALVLRMASEVQAGPDPAPPQEGLTLSQIREIAAEVGIEPERVSRAAALLPSPDDSLVNRLVGGQSRHRLEHSVPGVVPAGELGRVIDVARRALSTQGETREVLGALEWKGGTSTVSFGVSITPREDETTLQASTDRTELLAGIYAGVGISSAVVFTVLLGKLAFGGTDAGLIASFLSSLPPAFLIARTLWKRSTKKYRERLLHLMDAMAKEVEAVVEEVADSENGQGLGEEPWR